MTAVEPFPDHTDDCTGLFPDDTCNPVEGDWDQPPSRYVLEAVRNSEADGMPWCRIRRRAFEIMAEEER